MGLVSYKRLIAFNMNKGTLAQLENGGRRDVRKGILYCLYPRIHVEQKLQTMQKKLWKLLKTETNNLRPEKMYLGEEK